MKSHRRPYFWILITFVCSAIVTLSYTGYYAAADVDYYSCMENVLELIGGGTPTELRWRDATGPDRSFLLKQYLSNGAGLLVLTGWLTVAATGIVATRRGAWSAAVTQIFIAIVFALVFAFDMRPIDHAHDCDPDGFSPGAVLILSAPFGLILVLAAGLFEGLAMWIVRLFRSASNS